jgi:hypothetical protein
VGQPSDSQTVARQSEETSRLINAAVQDVVQTTERRAAVAAAISPPGQMRQRLTAVALAAVLPVLVLSYMTNVQSISLRALFTPGPPEGVARRQAEDALQQAVKEIELYKRDYAELPTTLAQVGVPVDGDWSYVYSQGQYRLVLRLHSQTVSFDSSQKSPDAPREK